MSCWEHFSHGADIGIRGIGSSVEDAFAMAALALTEVIVKSETLSPHLIIHIRCKEDDLELLFYDWINALVYEMDTKKIIFKTFRVRISSGQLEAECEGEKINPLKQDLAVEVKGATMTELKVAQVKEQWIAQCVVDV